MSRRGSSSCAVLMVVLGAIIAAAIPDHAWATAPTCQRTISAEVVALDQVYFYNRFMSFNPIGMVYALKRDVVPITGTVPGPGNARLRPDKRPRPLTLRANVGDCLDVTFYNWLSAAPPTFCDPNVTPCVPEQGPQTRTASMHVNGLQYDVLTSDGSRVGFNPSSLISPGQSIQYRWYADKEGTYLLYSHGALSGGEGDGGSLVLGLFGAVNVEPTGSTWYRSQLTSTELGLVRQRVCTTSCPPCAPVPLSAEPVQELVIVDEGGGGGGGGGTCPPCTTTCKYVFNYNAVYPNTTLPVVKVLDGGNRIVHSDLNAIIDQDATSTQQDCANSPAPGTCGDFREFTVIFHDEIKAVQATKDPRIGDLLKNNPVFHGVRDGFAINYGASGAGAIILANFFGVGPAANCPECKYEEFFLESWPNGDPALVVDPNLRVPYPDDPSNVHHSYLGDPVKFRNLHAGPKETHIFHLHAHQWLHEPEGDNSTYLDSQTIGPGSAFTYEILYGGSGNRNLTPGDAIFHCHLYPHFAQGMWELWRVHDTFEDGSAARNLPDAEIAGGTPNPAVVPMPGRALAPLPTAQFPGYPFYLWAAKSGDGLGAVSGHRPPQAPLDLDVFQGQSLDGGLPRNVILQAQVFKGRRGMFDKELMVNGDPNQPLPAQLMIIPQDGSLAEKAAMQFHETPQHLTQDTAGNPAYFKTNGLLRQPGSPYADPCDPTKTSRYIDYRAAAIQLDLVVNNAGWHDPQARIDVLNDDVDDFINRTREATPFFFRVNSKDCVRFHHTNLIPSTLEADPFQIFTPTDTIGQHIHLVKFDVTASDGSGNGWNYEDGTFAPEEVRERIRANNEWIRRYGTGTPLTIEQHPWFPTLAEAFGAQTTVQRWWADPLVNKLGLDRTIRTVFTHDHFGPSSIQHHGFYAALVVEPTGSTWWDPDPINGVGQMSPDPNVTGRTDGGPTLWKANILTGDLDGDGKDDSYREFNMAFADFAIVFDALGNPINPPLQPESISAADPGTMLINYRNEPIPLRISQNGDGVRQAGGPRGDMAFAFSSRVHGDPATPILPVYEGDRTKVRLIQGAQEEEHVYSMNGMRWPHEASDPRSGWYNAQALGISEHFEFVSPVPAACPTSRTFQPWELDELSYDTFDMLDPDPTTTLDDPSTATVQAALDARMQKEYSATGDTTDTQLQSAIYSSTSRVMSDTTLFNSLKSGDSTQMFYSVSGTTSSMSMTTGTEETQYSAIGGGTTTSITRNRREGCFSDYLYQSTSLDDLWNGMWGILRAYRDRRSDLRTLPNNPRLSQPFDDFTFNVSGRPSVPPHPQEPSPCQGLDLNGNPKTVTGNRVFDVVALAKPITYNQGAGINDPTGLLFVKAADESGVMNGSIPPVPLVMRAVGGECLTVNLTNHLPARVPDMAGDARLPPIVQMTVDDLTPSRRVSMHPQLVDLNVRNSDGTSVGFNADQTVRRNRRATYTWYVPYDLRGPRDPGSILVAGPESLGGTNVRDFGDVIKHGSQGLFGGLMLEPNGATFASQWGNSATVTLPTGSFKEFALFYQDGLNLRDASGGRIPDLPGNPGTEEADPEDSGSKGFNYKTEPFWVRLCNVFGPNGVCDFTRFDLNKVDQSDVLSSTVFGDPATPVFTATAGQAIRFRLLQPDGRSRQHAWALNGHEWLHEPGNPTSMTLGAQGGMGVMRHFNVQPLYGAGGLTQTPGDYLYREMGSFNFSGGLWGILRVEAVDPCIANPSLCDPCVIDPASCDPCLLNPALCDPCLSDPMLPCIY